MTEELINPAHIVNVTLDPEKQLQVEHVQDHYFMVKECELYDDAHTMEGILTFCDTDMPNDVYKSVDGNGKQILIRKARVIINTDTYVKYTKLFSSMSSARTFFNQVAAAVRDPVKCLTVEVEDAEDEKEML